MTSVPKEMLPVVDRPVLHYVLEEAFDAGLADVLLVTGRGSGRSRSIATGRRHDVGNLADYARTFLSFALEDERTAEAVRGALRARGWSEGASPPSRGAVPASL